MEGNQYVFLPGSQNGEPDILGWTFFIFLFLLFVFGVILLSHVRKRWKNELNETKSSGYVTFDDLWGKLNVSFIDNFVQNLPAIFLMVGLLGTFINLGLALKYLETSGLKFDSENLQKVLHSLGTKFKTSIWGVSASLIFRIILFRLYGKVLRELTNRKVEQINATTLKSEATLALGKVKSENERFETLTKALTTINQTNNKGLDEINKNVGLLVTSFSSFEQKTADLARGAELLKETANGLKETVNNVAFSLTTTMQTYAEETAKFSKAVRNFESKTEDVLTSVKTSINDFNGTVTNSFTQFEKGVKETLGEISSQLKASTDELKTNVKGALENMTGQVGKMTDVADAMRRINTELDLQITKLNKTWENSNQILNNMADYDSYINRKLNELFSDDGTLHSLFKNVTDALSMLSAERATERAIAQQLDGVNKQLTAIFKSIEDAKGMNELLREDEKNVADALSRLSAERATEREIVQQLDEVNTQLTSIFRSLEDGKGEAA